MKLPRTRLEVAKGNISYRGAKYFNDIPTDARGIESNRPFVHKLTKLANHSIEPD